MLFKAKKFVASKMSETKGGRSLIVSHFGEAGDTIVTVLKVSARRFSDVAVARELKRDLVKLVTKSVLLYTNKVVTAESATPARGPTLACLAAITDALERPGEADAAAVTAAVDAAHDALLPLLKPHVREHNWKRLTRILGYYGDAAFAAALLRDPAYEGDRAALARALRELSRPFEVDLRATSEFHAKTLRSRERALAAIVDRPTLGGFMKHDGGGTALGEWLRNSDGDGAAALEFLRAVDYYKTTANPRLRPIRAASIRAKFLDAPGGAIPALDEAAAASAVAELDGTSKPPPRDVFEALEAAALRDLEAKFAATFADSAVFARLSAEHGALALRADAAERALKKARSVGNADDTDSTDDDDGGGRASTA